MDNQLEHIGAIHPEQLDSARYFESLVQAAYQNGILQSAQLQRIQEGLIAALARMADRYTAGESSSVRTEVAQSMMRSLCYCIGIYLKSLPTAADALRALEAEPAEALFLKGRRLAAKEFDAARGIFRAVRKNRIATANIAYADTLGGGLDSFFRSYDVDYAAHETPAAIDYPLCMDTMAHTGIEYIAGYLRSLYWENKFCAHFGAQQTEAVLRGYDRRYADLLINIFSRVLTNALGRILCGETPDSLAIGDRQLQTLDRTLSPLTAVQTAALLRGAAATLCTALEIVNPVMRNYVLRAAEHIAPQVLCACQNGCPQTEFVPLKMERPEKELHDEDGASMDDMALRALVREAAACRHTADKVALILRRCRSARDLEDVVSAECLSGRDEFFAVFERLSAAQLALLASHACPDGEALHGPTDGEAAWQALLGQYLQALPVRRRTEVLDLAQRLSEQQ